MVFLKMQGETNLGISWILIYIYTQKNSIPNLSAIYSCFQIVFFNEWAARSWIKNKSFLKPKLFEKYAWFKNIIQ